MMRWLIVAALTLGCTSDEAARRALEASGFTDVQLTGFEWFGCGTEDFHNGFIAKNPRGQRVSGIVCCGWVKNCTVRF
jgi:hypothetical protein